MADEKIHITKDDAVVVMIGNTGKVQEYQNHPNVVFIDGKVRDGQMSALVPVATKAIILTEGVDHLNYAWVMSFCRTKHVPYLVRKSNQAVYDTLKQMLPNGGPKPSSEEVKDAFVKGKLAPLIPLIDFTKSNSENARILQHKARELRISSTEGSLAQLVANQRRKMSGTAVPKSARPKLDVTVDLLDGMISGLTDMREFLIATCEENRILRDKAEKLRKIME